MLFHSSPALRRIRQLARLIRRHPDLPVHSCNTPWRGPEQPHGTLPDPAQFVDSSVRSSDGALTAAMRVRGESMAIVPIHPPDSEPSGDAWISPAPLKTLFVARRPVPG